MRRVYTGLLLSLLCLALLLAGNQSVVQAQETPPQATSVIYLPLVAAPPRVEVTLFTEEDNGDRNAVTSSSLPYGVRALGMAVQVAGAGGQEFRFEWWGNGQRLEWLDSSGTLNSTTPDDIVGTIASSATAEPLPPTTYRIIFFLNNAPVDERSVTIQSP